MVAVKSAKRTRVRWAVAIVLAIAALRIYPEFFPWGTNPITVLTSCSWGASFDSTQLSKSMPQLSDDVNTWFLFHQIRSPRKLETLSNADELRHPVSNINYWTWVISDNLLWGPSVVTQGFMQGDAIKNGRPPNAVIDNIGNTTFLFQKAALPVERTRAAHN